MRRPTPLAVFGQIGRARVEVEYCDGPSAVSALVVEREATSWRWARRGSESTGGVLVANRRLERVPLAQCDRVVAESAHIPTPPDPSSIASWYLYPEAPLVVVVGLVPRCRPPARRTRRLGAVVPEARSARPRRGRRARPNASRCRRSSWPRRRRGLPSSSCIRRRKGGTPIDDLLAFVAADAARPGRDRARRRPARRDRHGSVIRKMPLGPACVRPDRSRS